ncbi:hypothetical protein B0H15DRAFT_292421 [Mycena belliarum]|uniref:Uncharacterized protein n=1 Tax=Mycena belliarum TaxID=1033014 RepID=A0AAD6U811_9AGAR|nr:hypothetical protein B0H15DRAFT_292421 [Mycena belliae]
MCLAVSAWQRVRTGFNFFADPPYKARSRLSLLFSRFFSSGLVPGTVYLFTVRSLSHCFVFVPTCTTFSFAFRISIIYCRNHEALHVYHNQSRPHCRLRTRALGTHCSRVPWIQARIRISRAGSSCSLVPYVFAAAGRSPISRTTKSTRSWSGSTSRTFRKIGSVSRPSGRSLSGRPSSTRRTALAQLSQSRQITRRTAIS